VSGGLTSHLTHFCVNRHYTTRYYQYHYTNKLSLLSVVYTTLAGGRRWSATLEASPPPWTVTAANVFVFNQYCWASSWIWSRFHVVLILLNSDRFHSICSHNVIKVLRLLSRLQRVGRHSVIVCVVMKLSSRPIIDGLLIAVNNSVEQWLSRVVDVPWPTSTLATDSRSSADCTAVGQPLTPDAVLRACELYMFDGNATMANVSNHATRERLWRPLNVDDAKRACLSAERDWRRCGDDSVEQNKIKQSKASGCNAQRATDCEPYRCRSETASAQPPNMHEAALIDVSVDIALEVAAYDCLVSALFSKVSHWQTSYTEFYWQS